MNLPCCQSEIKGDYGPLEGDGKTPIREPSRGKGGDIPPAGGQN